MTVPKVEPGLEWLARLGERGRYPPSPIRTVSGLAGPLVGLPPKNPLFTGEPYTARGTGPSGASGFRLVSPYLCCRLCSVTETICGPPPAPGWWTVCSRCVLAAVRDCKVFLADLLTSMLGGVMIVIPSTLGSAMIAIPSKLGNMVWEVCAMDKDEILAKSRKENKDMDFVEAEVLSKANGIALNVGIIVCGLLSILHAIFRETVDFSAWTVYFSALTATMLYKYVKLRRRHELLIGLFYAACCVMFFVFYLRDVLGVS